MKMRIKLILMLLLTANVVLAQSNAGGIEGKVTDENGKPLDYASVQVLEGGLVKAGKYSDENGNYRVKPLAPGEYTLIVSYTGKGKTQVTVTVYNDKMSKQNVTLGKTVGITEVKVKAKKLIDAANVGDKTKGKEDIAKLATVNTGDIIGGMASVYQSRQGSNQVSIGGGRTSNTLYMIDGMMVLGSRGTNFPPGAISSVQVMNTGMSAKFGNATGGIIALNTRGISKQTVGGIQAQTSVDGYFNNLVSFDVSGPLYSKKVGNEKIPKVGYVLNVSGTYNKDGNPFFYKYDKLKPEVLARLQETPLVQNPNGAGSFLEAAEMVTANDFVKIKAREQGEDYGLNYLGKLEFQPTQNMNITLGTYFNYSNARGFSIANSFFAPEANSRNNNYSARGFVRLMQSLGRSDESKVKDSTYKKSAFSNAFYTLQLSYQREYSDGANPNHGRNTFDYGYVGKFTETSSPFYILDTALGYRGLKYLGDRNTDLTFTRGGVNPLLENYTAQIMGNPNYNITNLIQLQSLGGLLNGDGPNSAYSLYTGVGAQISSYSYAQEDRFNLNLDASFDLEQGLGNKAKTDPIVHQIEFGLGYEQRVSRGYSVGASGLYQLMRLLTNSHLQTLDLNSPIYVVGGVEYTKAQLDAGEVVFSEFDSIKYNRLPVAADQVRFDKSLRGKLFGNENATDLIDVFDLNPSTFSLDMFSAADLLNQGNSYVGYNGYDYLGNIQRKQPSFNDFWTKKDARGDYLRPIAAYNPNYMFGYILDKFSFKDINFNVGVRIDRFDANQNVLRDPYSLFGVQKLSTIAGRQYRTAFDEDTRQTAPDPIASGFDGDYVPYVDNNQSSNPTLVGYRKGDIWFDPFGKEIADPTVLSEKYANGLPIQPWLTDTKDSLKSENYKIGNAFEDYRPDITVSPRVQFTFPITDASLFYGNYDIVTQYPSGNNFVSPDDYFYIAERRSTLNNANLRMEKSINYTLGYEQAITKKSKIGIEVYYRERKDQIQLQQYILAYPISYTSYGNRDFSSTKGFTFRYDLRRTGPIRFTVDYTLQFAEGTGSNSTSAASLISSGQPNLRTVFPMSFDSRHMLNIVLDYRYAMNHNKGPQIGKHYVFNGLGANLNVRSRSGEPYTRSSVATPIVGGDFNSVPIIGTRNGSRLPWNYELGLRVDKDFMITNIGRKKDEEGKIMTNSGRPLVLNVYTFIQNLLNTRNALGVYSYTGVPDDDGYLSSPQGQQALQTSYLFPSSFEFMYNSRMSNAGFYNLPRRINVGFTLSF